MQWLLSEVCTGTGFQSHPRLFPHPLHPSLPSAVYFVIHPHLSPYQFISVAPIPVDAVSGQSLPHTVKHY